MAPLPPYARRADQSAVPDTTDLTKIGSSKWNKDLLIYLGSVCDALSKLDIQADQLAYFTSASAAALTSLSAFGRLVVAANDNAAARALLSAVNLAGDTMTGDLSMGGFHKVTGLAAPVSASDAARKADVDAIAAAVAGALVFKGAWDASAGTFPGGGAALTGWFYKVSVAGTVNGVSFSVGDDVYAVVDNASATTYAANWLKVEGSITLAEVQAAVGFTFGSLAAASSVTASIISDASANGRSLIQAADYAAMRTLLGLGSAALKAANTTPNAGDVIQWDTGNKYPAGDGSQLTNVGNTTIPGLANYVVDGAVEVCQPGNGYTLPTAAAWNAVGPDMFMAWATGTVVSAGTVQQATAAPVGRAGTALLVAGATITGTGKVFMRTRISAKDARKLKNATGGFAVRVYQDTGAAINVVTTIRKANAADNFGGGTTQVATATNAVNSATDTLISIAAIALGDVSNGIELEIEFQCGAVTTKNFYATEWWLYEGSTIPSAYPREDFKRLVEKVQRFRCRSYDYGTANAAATRIGLNYVAFGGSWPAGTYMTSTPRFPVAMRAAPSISLWDGAGNANAVSDYNGAWTDNVLSGSIAAANIAAGGFMCSANTGSLTGGHSLSLHYDADARLT